MKHCWEKTDDPPVKLASRFGFSFDRPQLAMTFRCKQCHATITSTTLRGKILTKEWRNAGVLECHDQVVKGVLEE